MAITLDAKVQQSGFGSSSLTKSFTIGTYSGHAILVVVWTAGSSNGTTSTIALQTTTGCTWNGSNLTFLATDGGAFGEANEVCEVWYMIDPPSGTHNIVCTMNGTPSGHPNGYQLQAASFFGAGALTVSGSAHNHDSGETITISSATGSLVVVGATLTEAHSATAPTGAGGQTDQFTWGTFWADAIANSDVWGQLTSKAGGSSVTVSYTLTSGHHSSIVGFSIDEGAAANSGTATASVAKLTASGSGVEANPGTGTATVRKVSAQGTGSLGPNGAAAALVQKLVTQGTGANIFTATGADLVAKLTAQGDATVIPTGIGAALVKKLTSVGSGALALIGTGAALVQKLAALGVGGQVVYEDFGVKRTYDPSKYAENATVQFCVIGKCTNASFPLIMRLWNDEDDELLDTVQVASTTMTEVFSGSAGLTMPTTAKRLRVEMGGIEGQGPYTAYAADLVIDA